MRPSTWPARGEHTSWTGEQNDDAARQVHADDERVSRARSEEQVADIPKKA